MRSFVTLFALLSQVIFLSSCSASTIPIRHLESRNPHHHHHDLSILSGMPLVGDLIVPTHGKHAKGTKSLLSRVPIVGRLLLESNNDGTISPVQVNNNRRSLNNGPSYDDDAQSLALQFHGEAASLPAIIMKVTDSLRLVCDDLKMIVISRGPAKPEELVPLLTKIKVILAGAISDINLGIVDNPSEYLFYYQGQAYTVRTIAGLVSELFSVLVVTLGAAKNAVHASGLRVNVPLQLIIDIDGLLSDLLLVLFSLVSGLLDAFCPRIQHLYTVLFDLHYVSIIKTLGIRG